MQNKREDREILLRNSLRGWYITDENEYIIYTSQDEKKFEIYLDLSLIGK